jgi:hypothetical protein
MAQPTPYDRIFSFTNYATDNPSDPLPGNQVDAELNAAKQTLDELLANLALIQRDDTELANRTVGYDQLKSELYLGLDLTTIWSTGVHYTTRASVIYGSRLYRCLVEHTSGTFSTDLAAGKWYELLDLSAALIPALVVQSVTGSSGVVATDTDVVLVRRSAPSTTALTLPDAVAYQNRRLRVADLSTSITDHEITLTPNDLAQEIMGATSYVIRSNPSSKAGVTLHAVEDPADATNAIWIVAP